jgi:hypothetical protein
MDAPSSETVKAPKQRKPFAWTEARKAAFERCKKARDEKLVHKAKAQSEGKTVESTKQKQLQNLVKNASLLRKLLDGIEDEVKPPVKEAVKPVEVKEKKEQVKEKPRKIAPPPPPEPESEEEEEEVDEPFVPPPPRKNINQFRYTSTSSKNYLPRPPLPTHNQRPVEPPRQQEVKKSSGYLFL